MRRRHPPPVVVLVQPSEPPVPEVTGAREQFVDFHFQHPLEKLLHALPSEGLLERPRVRRTTPLRLLSFRGAGIVSGAEALRQEPAHGSRA